MTNQTSMNSPNSKTRNSILYSLRTEASAERKEMCFSPKIKEEICIDVGLG